MKKKTFFIAGILALIISLIFDKQLILWFISIRDQIQNQFLDYFLGWFAHFGSIFVIFVIMTSLFLWEERKREWIPTLWCSFLIALGITFLLKYLILRPRPDVVLGITSLIEKTNPSFPSGHLTAVFSAIAILDREFPKLKWAWIGFACLIAISRLYVGVHYFSDIMAGILIGGSISILFVWLEEKHKIFKVLIKKLKNIKK